MGLPSMRINAAISWMIPLLVVGGALAELSMSSCGGEDALGLFDISAMPQTAEPGQNVFLTFEGNAKHSIHGGKIHASFKGPGLADEKTFELCTDLNLVCDKMNPLKKGDPVSARLMWQVPKAAAQLRLIDVQIKVFRNPVSAVGQELPMTESHQ